MVRHEVSFPEDLIASSRLPRVTALPRLLQCNVVGDAQTLRYSPIRNAFADPRRFLTSGKSHSERVSLLTYDFVDDPNEGFRLFVPGRFR
jgi:hypothetical protein